MKIIKHYFVFVLSVFSVLTSCSSQNSKLSADTETKSKYHASQLAEYFESLSDPTLPGFSYLVSKDGKVILKGGKGLADVEKKEFNDEDTIFRTGSITKQFTAVSILQLAEKGELSLSDNLGKYFPGLPNADKITIRNLLNHTSGIWDQEKDEDFPFPIDEAVSPDVHLSYIQNNGTYFEPGEEWRYSSNAYFILGLIVEKVSELPLATYMQDNIFGPLGMRNSGLYGTRTPYERSAIGYGVNEGKHYEEVDVNMETYNGAAALYSTVEDLFIWNEALHNGKVLSDASYADAISAHEFVNGFVPFVAYGLGLGFEDLGGQYTIGHPGQIKGFHSEILRIPDDNINVIFLSNVNSYQFTVKGRFAEQIIEVMYGE